MDLASPSCFAICLGDRPWVRRCATRATVRPSSIGATDWVREIVLLGRCVDQRGQLVHLKERPPGLGDMDAHALHARGVVIDVAVLDRVVEDRGELVEHFADRARRQRHHSLLVLVAQLGARLDRRTQLARLLELVSLEGEAQVRVDLIEPVVGEEGQQMRLDLPAVLLLRVGADRLGPENAVDLGLQPA